MNPSGKAAAPHGTALVWFRRDLRLADHYALLRACRDFEHVIPVFVLFEDDAGVWSLGGAQRWWLHHSLKQLDKSLRDLGSLLVLRHGDPVNEIATLVRESGARAVLWHRVYEGGIAEIDAKLTEVLRAQGCEPMAHRGDLLREPDEVKSGSGAPFKVFTPFWRVVSGMGAPPEPMAPPRKIPAPAKWPRSLDLRELRLDPNASWTYSIADSWVPGEAGAKARLKAFSDERVARYKIDRDFPAQPGVSRLSPHLHFGEVTVRQVWHAFVDRTKGGMDARFEPFRRQLGWREFGRHSLWAFPTAPDAPMRPEFLKFPWRRGKSIEADLESWKRGMTGYPLVDAGMRELWQTGWMHNRVRMVVGSFLVKNLRIHWIEGAKWFWDTLVDADLANNTLGWQWAAGCGFDAAPYFRVFNPVLQSLKFDPEGAYIRRWVPELRHLPIEYLHAPWKAPVAVLERARITGGKTYPQPVVDPEKGRELALEAYEEMKSAIKTSQASK